MPAMMCMWKSEDGFVELVLCLYLDVSSGDLTAGACILRAISSINLWLSVVQRQKLD